MAEDRDAHERRLQREFAIATKKALKLKIEAACAFFDASAQDLHRAMAEFTEAWNAGWATVDLYEQIDGTDHELLINLGIACDPSPEPPSTSPAAVS